MISIRAKIRNGRVVVDEACDLPDGAEVEVTVTEVSESARFRAAIESGLADVSAGRLVDHDEVRRRLEARFGPFPG